MNRYCELNYSDFRVVAYSEENMAADAIARKGFKMADYRTCTVPAVQHQVAHQPVSAICHFIMLSVCRLSRSRTGMRKPSGPIGFKCGTEDGMYAAVVTVASYYLCP